MVCEHELWILNIFQQLKIPNLNAAYILLIPILLLSGNLPQNQDNNGFEVIFPYLEASRLLDSLPPQSVIGHIGTMFSTANRPPHDRLNKAESIQLQEGDLLLRKGYGWVSDRIADILDEEYRVTHCALILRKGYSEPHVLHSLSNEKVNGIFVEPLADYLFESQQGSLVGIRLKSSAEDRAAVVQEAKRLLAKKVPFDMAFDDADTNKLYCAELMGYIFNNIYKKDLLPEKYSVLGMKAIRMRNFFNSTYFEVLFNHFDAKK